MAEWPSTLWMSFTAVLSPLVCTDDRAEPVAAEPGAADDCPAVSTVRVHSTARRHKANPAVKAHGG